MVRRLLSASGGKIPIRFEDGLQAMEKTLLVVCELSDCVYYNPYPKSPQKCLCSHPDKAGYPSDPCPLYRMDWQKKMKKPGPK